MCIKTLISKRHPATTVFYMFAESQQASSSLPSLKARLGPAHAYGCYRRRPLAGLLPSAGTRENVHADASQPLVDSAVVLSHTQGLFLKRKR